MTNSLNLLLLLVPEALLGPLLLCLFVAGGFVMILGFRRLGMALVLTSVIIPIAYVFVESLLNALFEAMPGWLVIPISIVFQLIIFFMVGWLLIKILFGQNAINAAKGHLLADFFRWMLRGAFSRTGLVAFGGFSLFLYLRVVL